MNVHATLSAEAQHDKVWVTFRIENRGERRIWLPRTIAAGTVHAGPLFALRVHPDGAPVAYTGPAAPARTAAAAADYFELPPHSAHTHTIDITPDYAFRPGPHDYELRYDGAALADAHHPEAVTPLAMRPVVFRHGGGPDANAA